MDNKNFQKSPSMSDIVRMSNDKKAKNKISSLQRIQKIKEKVEQIKNLQIIEFL